jgi:hypothetical protein
MKARHAIFALVALAVAVTLTSVAAAGQDAAKQRVAIDMKGGQSFVLFPLQAGAFKRDSGTSSVSTGSNGGMLRGGQQVQIYNHKYILRGKQGSLTIRERVEWVDVSNVNAPGFDYPPGVAIGTWKVVGGTGAYSKISGGGRSGHAGMGAQWFIRQEGYLTVP